MTTLTSSLTDSAPILTHTRLPGVGWAPSVTGRYTNDISRADRLTPVERDEPLVLGPMGQIERIQKQMLKRALVEHKDQYSNGLSAWSLLPEVDQNSCVWPGQETVCPACGGENIHQVAIVSTEPASERITIAFLCEHCPAEPHLHIVQHKGINTIYWDAEILLKDFGIYDEAVHLVEQEEQRFSPRLVNELK
jgi:hypothetical protein